MKWDIYQNNTIQDFWSITPSPTDEEWQAAIYQNLHHLQPLPIPEDITELVPYILSETAYGENVWRLSPTKQIYYQFKPLLSRPLITVLRKLYHMPHMDQDWFIEDRYVNFLWGVFDYLVSHSDEPRQFAPLWPDNKQFAFVLTHDIEEAAGQQLVTQLADIDEKFGFHSAFYFVPERYPLDYGLIDELKKRGFEVGVHGLKHDGKLFSSKQIFDERVEKINYYIEKLGAVGFSAPFTHRNAVWLQKLNVEYDRSFFDIDLYEPMPGGVMSIWPYQLGKFIELPYTLLQDFTVTQIMHESTSNLWFKKLQFIQKYHGMALLNSHPDYLRFATTKQAYVEFLSRVSELDDYWHALPREVASWWRGRSNRAKQNGNL